MTMIEEFLLLRMTVRRWLLALFLFLSGGLLMGWYIGQMKPAPGTLDATGTPTMEDFNSFLVRFVPQMKAQQEAMLSPAMSVDCFLHTADLMKTESAVNPIVGVALINGSMSLNSETPDRVNTTYHLYTITFAPDEDGKWQVLRAISKITDVLVYPENPRQMSNVGKEVEMTLVWLKAAAANAQR